MILHPFDVVWEASVLARSTRSLAEHVRLVQDKQLRKVFVIAEDISFLRECTSLEIEACGKISDFTWLNYLTELEDLTLWGSNTLPDLMFLRHMQKLRSLRVTMNVADGDLSLCRGIPYVHCRNHRHNNLKNEELPKGMVNLG